MGRASCSMISVPVGLSLAYSSTVELTMVLTQRVSALTGAVTGIETALAQWQGGGNWESLRVTECGRAASSGEQH